MKTSSTSSSMLVLGSEKKARAEGSETFNNLQTNLKQTPKPDAQKLQTNIDKTSKKSDFWLRTTLKDRPEKTFQKRLEKTFEKVMPMWWSKVFLRDF
jgi:hypothetical protein